MAQGCRTVCHFRLLLAGSHMPGLYGDGGFVNHGPYFGRRLPAWLARLTGDDFRQRAFILLQQRGKFLHHGLTSSKRLRRPAGKRGAGSPACLGHLLGIGIVPLPEPIAIYRILLLAPNALTGHPVAVNP